MKQLKNNNRITTTSKKLSWGDDFEHSIYFDDRYVRVIYNENKSVSKADIIWEIENELEYYITEHSDESIELMKETLKYLKK